MKTQCIVILLILLYASCSDTNPVTYQTAIDNCIEVVKKKVQKDSTILGIISRDCVIGCTIPEINSTTTSGIKVDQTYFVGKPGLINFWFEACPPCIEEIPYLNQLVDSLGTDRYYFLTIGKDSKEQIEEFLAEHPWKFDHVINGKDLLKTSFQNPFGFPLTLMVDRDGKIVQSLGHITEKNLNEVISDLKSLP
jgi:thiol-disulfide isomerase/thioredoxin